MSARIGAAAPVGVHACALLVSEEHRWELLAGFIRDGLTNNEQVILVGIAGEVTRLDDRLGAEGIDRSRAQRHGQLITFSDADSTAFFDLTAEAASGRLIEHTDDALHAGYRACRLSGVFTDQAVGSHEEVFAEVTRGRPLTFLCPYQATELNSSQITRIRDNHEFEVRLPSLHDDGLLRVTRDADGVIRLSGEVDPSNRAALVAVLDQAAAVTAGPLEMDLAALRFIDTGGLDAIVSLARAMGDRRGVRLHHCRPLVRRLVRLLEPTCTLLRVADGE